jgi:hypothetical protein
MTFARILAGLLVAPPAGLLFIILGARMLDPSHSDTSLFAMALYFAYAITLVVGVPIMLLFRLFALRRWWQFAIAGALLGPIAMLIIQYNSKASLIPHMEAAQFVACASLGLVCALIFWVIALFRVNDAHAT